MTDASRLLAELARDPDRLDDLPEDALPELLAALERVRARVWMRMSRPPEPTTNGTPAPSPPDRLLTVEELAERLSVAPDWIYRRSDSLPFARKLSDRTLRFSERGLKKWLESRR